MGTGQGLSLQCSKRGRRWVGPPSQGSWGLQATPGFEGPGNFRSLGLLRVHSTKGEGRGDVYDTLSERGKGSSHPGHALPWKHVLPILDQGEDLLEISSPVFPILVT